MAWASSILNKSFRADGALVVNVRFQDGARMVDQSFDTIGATDSDIKARIQSKLSALTNADLLNAALPTGVINPSPPAQTQNEIDFKIWAPKFSRYRRANDLVSLGIIESGDTAWLAAIEAIRVDLHATFKPAFLNML